MDLGRELDLCLRSRYSLICIVSLEEERVLEELEGLCERSGRALLCWDHADFFHCRVGDMDVPTAKDPLTALEAVASLNGEVVVVLRDFHQCWDRQPRVMRKLRSLAQELTWTHVSIIVTQPSSEIPQELRNVAVELDFPLPDVDDLGEILARLARTPGVRIQLTPKEKDKLLRSALGLSAAQAQRVFAKAIVSDGVLDISDLEAIIAEKRQLVRSSSALELFNPPETFAQVGGLGALKRWLALRAKAFSPKAREYGLPAPRGIALIGIPGTGKSLSAKTIASAWQMPLLRLDLGALYGELVGQSEANTRRALRIAEAIAPCVLWIDEIEKGLAAGGGDGGTSQRVLGTVLSWLQEKTAPVFMVVTANDISMLPAELLRRGRFDEIFFLDLPTISERREILTVHLGKRSRNPATFDLDHLAAISEGYVGAELEQAVIDALVAGFADGARPITNADLTTALRRMVPLSRSQRELVQLLRSWLAEGRAISASIQAAADAPDQRTAIPIVPNPREDS